jgi:hypothetical protein
MINRMHPIVPICIGSLVGIAVVFVGYSLGWSDGAIGTICLAIIGIAVLWQGHLADQNRASR